MDETTPQEINEQPGITLDDRVQETTTAATAPFTIAEFWRRAVAAVIDSMLISAVAFALVFFLLTPLAYRLGTWGRLVGLALGVAYFGIGSSQLANGQTVGKKILGIRVVGRDGKPLSMGRSIVRAFILNVILLSNGWVIPAHTEVEQIIRTILVTIQGGILFFGSIALIYLLLFNRATRQGPHDLLARSYVVRHPVREEGMVIPTMPRKHYAVLGGLAVLALIIPITLAAVVLPQISTSQSLYQKLNSDPRFFAATLSYNTTVQVVGSDQPNQIRDVRIQMWAKEPCQVEDCIEISREIARIALEEDEGIRDFDGMRVWIMQKGDFGWATRNEMFRADYTIEDWEEQLEGE